MRRRRRPGAPVPAANLRPKARARPRGPFLAAGPAAGEWAAPGAGRWTCQERPSRERGRGRRRRRRRRRRGGSSSRRRARRFLVLRRARCAARPGPPRTRRAVGCPGASLRPLPRNAGAQARALAGTLTCCLSSMLTFDIFSIFSGALDVERQPEDVPAAPPGGRGRRVAARLRGRLLLSGATGISGARGAICVVGPASE